MRCSICCSPNELQQVVAEKLASRVPLFKIAAHTGFSKSALGRHKLFCSRRNVIENHRAGRTRVAKAPRIHVWYPDLAPEPIVAPDDWIFKIVYEREETVQTAPNPTPFLNAAHTEALAENQSRNAPADTP